MTSGSSRALLAEECAEFYQTPEDNPPETEQMHK
jgi:hypothetical protein